MGRIRCVVGSRATVCVFYLPIIINTPLHAVMRRTDMSAGLAHPGLAGRPYSGSVRLLGHPAGDTAAQRGVLSQARIT